MASVTTEILHCNGARVSKEHAVAEVNDMLVIHSPR